MYRIQHSDRYPPLLRVSPRGARGLPVADECNNDPETWWSRCVWPLPTVATKFHVLNRIFLEPAGRAVPNKSIHLKHTVPSPSGLMIVL